MSTELKEAGNAAIESAKAVAHGELPSNKQINETLDKTRQALRKKIMESPVDKKTMAIAKDAEAVISAAQQFWNEKNKDDRLQNFFSESKKVVEDLSTNVKTDIEESKHLREQMDEVLQAGKQVGLEMMNSKEFRNLLGESVELIQQTLLDMAAPEKKGKGGKEKGGKAEKGQKGKKKAAESPASDRYSLRTKKQKTEEGEARAVIKPLTAKQLKTLSQKMRDLLKKMSEKEEFQQGIESLFVLLDHIKERANAIKNNPTYNAEYNDHIKKVLNNARSVLEGFSGGESLEDLFSSVGDIFGLLTENEDLSSYLKDCRKYLSESLKNPDSLTLKEGIKKGDDLIKQGRELLNSDEVRDGMENLMDQFHSFLDRISSDTLREKFVENVRKFASGMIADNSGKINMFSLQQSLQSMKSLVMPVVFTHIENIPLPKLEGSTDTLDYSLENVTFSGKDILPERMKMEFKSNMDINVKDLANEETQAELYMEVKDIKTSLKDLKFSYKRKEFPRIEDEGVADVSLSGEGTSIVLKWIFESENRGPIQITTVEALCAIDRLDINIKEAKHEILDSLITTLFSGYLKEEMEKQIEHSLISMSTAIAEEFNQVFKSMSTEEKSVSSK